MPDTQPVLELRTFDSCFDMCPLDYQFVPQQIHGDSCFDCLNFRYLWLAIEIAAPRELQEQEEGVAVMLAQSACLQVADQLPL